VGLYRSISTENEYSIRESRNIHNPDHPLLKYKSVQSDVSPRVSTVMSAGNSSSPGRSSFSSDSLRKDILTSPSISSFSSTSHSSISLLPGSSSFSFDSSSRDFSDMSFYNSPITSITMTCCYSEGLLLKRLQEKNSESYILGKDLHGGGRSVYSTGSTDFRSR